MKKRTGEEPKVRVVDEESAGGEVVRLGGREEILRLGEKGAQPVEAKPVPQRLEIATTAGGEARDASVEEILGADVELESPEAPLEQSWGGESKLWLGMPWGWFAIVGLICVGFSVWSLRHIFQNRHAAEKVTQRATEIVEEDRRKQEEALDLYQRLEKRVGKYLACESTEELLKHVREPERIAPLMRDYYAGRAPEPVTFISLAEFTPLTIKQRSFWALRAETSSGRRALLVEQTENDDGLVDWETDVCYQPMPWEKYIAERPTGRFVFRVTVRPDNFYVYEFADQSVYRNLQLGARGSHETLHGYVLRGSDVAREIQQVLGKRRRSIPMMVELEFVEDAVGKRSVLINEVVSTNWCLVEESL